MLDREAEDGVVKARRSLIAVASPSGDREDVDDVEKSAFLLPHVVPGVLLTACNCVRESGRAQSHIERIIYAS
jgi:hypothetical protein